MRVKLEIDPDRREPYAVLYLSKLTPALQAAVSMLEKEEEETELAAQYGEKIYLLAPEDIELIRTEGREITGYDKTGKRYLLNKPLYEWEERLGKNFIRISKCVLVNIRRIHHVEASFNGTMELKMKNGEQEIITRSYRRGFKERLGV